MTETWGRRAGIFMSKGCRLSWVLVAVTAVAGGCDYGREAPRIEFTPPPAPAAVSIAPIPAPSFDDPEKIALGRDLFNDPRLSRDATLTCASCHHLADGGDDGRPLSIGIDGQPGRVNTPTVLNAALSAAQFWDGRARTLEEQIVDTITSPTEMDGDLEQIVARLREDDTVVDAFRAVYGKPVTAETVVDALAAYLAVLVTPNAPFDRFLNGDFAAVEPAALHGFEAFMRLGCVSCHQGRAVGGNLFQYFGVMGNYFEDRGHVTEADYGRFNVTGRETDRFRFKVPSLRNVALTAPYFHDGSAETLEDAVRTMVKYQLGRPATDEEVSHIVAFLESLTGELPESLP